MKKWVTNKKETMSKVRFQITVIVFAILFSTIAVSLSYFAASIVGDAIADLTVEVGTTHQLIFSNSADISIKASTTNFAENMGSLHDNTTTSAQLIAGSGSVGATEYYSVIVNVESNNFEYTTSGKTAELILEITDSEGNLITSAEGLTYVEVKDHKTGEIIKGFDMTEVIGVSRIKTNHKISTTSDTAGTTQNWNVKMTFVNLNSNQNANAGKALDASVILTDDANYSTEAPFIELLETEYVTNNSGYSSSEVEVLVNVLDPNGSNLVSASYCVSNSACEPNILFTDDDLYKEQTISAYALNSSSVETYNYDIQYKITLENEGINVLCVLSENETTSATVCSRKYYIDLTAPTIGEIVLDGTIGNNGWYTSIVNVSSSESIDYGSGVASSIVDKNVIDYSSSSVLITLTAVDNAGNTSETTTTVKTDLEAPIIIGAENLNYYKGQSYDLLENVSCTDNLSSKDECTVTIKSTDLNINVAGNYTVTYSSVDNAGNETVQAVTITVDADAPTINSVTASALNTNGWANEDFTVEITSTDNSGTGIKSTLYCQTTSSSCTPSISGDELTISTEGENTVCALVTDNNGKSTTLCESGFNLDKTDPIVGTVNVAGTLGDNSWYTSNVTISSTNGTDSLSGHFSTSTDITSITSDTTGKTVTITIMQRKTLCKAYNSRLYSPNI